MSRPLGSAALALLVAGCATVGAPTLVELRNGTIHGIELLNANQQLGAGNGGLAIFNEASGWSSQVPIPV